MAYSKLETLRGLLAISGLRRIKINHCHRHHGDTAALAEWLETTIEEVEQVIEFLGYWSLDWGRRSPGSRPIPAELLLRENIGRAELFKRQPETK